MTNYFLLIPILISFFVTLFIIPLWIRKAKQINLVWDDMNKIKSDKAAGSGGMIVILGFIVGAFFYIAYKIFFLKSQSESLVEIFALITVVLLLACVGFVDDLLGWKQGGLSKRSRIIMVLLTSIPLIAINAGKSSMVLPFIGEVELGLIYPLLFIPIGITGAAVTFNFLAGFNGLEAGQGSLLLTALAIVSYFTGSVWLSIIALCVTAALLAFLLFNFCPARIFPGDSLTYPIGGLIAIMAILGNFEKIAVFFFIPIILEVILKARGKLIKQSFGKPLPGGSLDLKYDKIYSLNHLSIYLMKKLDIKPTERKVVLSIWSFQFIIILVGFLIFRGGIF